MRNVLLHFHLFKNAGTTIDWCLKRSFGDQFFEHREDNIMLRGGMHYLMDYLIGTPNIVAISSHHMAFDPRWKHRDIHPWYIILLRKPLIRAVSIYEFEKRQTGDSLGAKKAKYLDMRGYFKWRLGVNRRGVIRNFHTHYLSGFSWRKNFIIYETDLDKALLNCRQSNVIIGFVERYDESMVLFEHVLQPQFNDIDLSYITQNQSPQSIQNPMTYLKSQLGESIYAKLIEKNTMDLRLYENLERDFTTHLAEIPGFEDKLLALRKRSAALRHVPT